MSLPSPLCHDPLARALERRGYSPAECEDVTERVAIRVESGVPESVAIVETVGFLPSELRKPE